MKPSDYLLPEKFVSYRPGQVEALNRIKDSTSRFIVLQAPTGSGKSLIAATLQRMLSTRVLYLVRTLQLEQQLKDDFPYAELLKGRANYPTLLYSDKFPLINAAHCTKTRERHCRWCCDGSSDAEEAKCQGPLDCPYHVAKVKALRADLAVLNMALFLVEANYVGGFSEAFPWMVLDEADTTEESLMGFVEFTIPQRWISKYSIPPPKRKTVQETWLSWASEVVRPKLEDALDRLRKDWGVQSIEEEDKLERAISRLGFFVQEANSSPWVYMGDESSYAFKPVFVSKYGPEYIWKHASRFLLMSATIISPQQMARDLGIPKGEVDFIDLKSEFDPKRRPVFYIPKVGMSEKTKAFAWKQMVKGLDERLDVHKNVKVLVHSVSTALAKFVAANSRHKDRIITYTDGMRREEALNLFKTSKGPKVFVAQSMDRGVSLDDDLCRVIILLKVPFPNLGDKQISQRVYGSRDGNDWYIVQTWRTLIQSSGRGMRHKDDWCLVEILDAQFGDRLLAKSKHLAPRWWRDALRLPK